MAQTAAKKKTDSKAKKKPAPKREAAPKPPESGAVRRIVIGLCFIFAAALVIIGIFARDGVVVAWLCAFLKGIFGYGFWICAPVFLLAGYIMFAVKDKTFSWRLTATLLLPLITGALMHVLIGRVVVENQGSVGKLMSVLYTGGKDMLCGGVLGSLVGFALDKAFSIYGAAILLFLALVFFALSAFGVTPVKMVRYFSGAKSDRQEKKERRKAEKLAAAEADDDDDEDGNIPLPEPEPKRRAKQKRSAVDIPLDDEPTFDKKPQPAQEEKKASRKKQKSAAADDIEVTPLTIEEAGAIAGVSPVTLSGKGNVKSGGVSDPPAKKASAAEVAAERDAIQDAIDSASPDGEYEKPPIFLLKKGHVASTDATAEMNATRERLETTIKSFGVSARIVDMTRGPTVTRYDLELEQGVKLSRLTNLAGDIALALGVVSVRIAPIPDKISTVGIEVPNKVISTVYLRDIIDSPRFAQAKSKLSFAIGKDIAGQAVVGNIAKLPHLLIAGTTGSGKSVCMNSLIISLLYKADPDEVKLIMIDPKMVELGVYNGIPHLYVPVVTDPKKAAGALQWAVTEMLKRYRLFSEMGVRSIDAYNDHIKDDPEKQKMASIVIVIDELADLMLVASKDVEESICRVAQMGRAAGIHLVIATQRPSSDVITGLMKANIPSRIAFAVSSALESRIILDNAGAEKLIGMGDMLYAPIGCGKPLRVQGAFVSDEERDSIVQFIKKQAGAQYAEDVMAQIDKAAEDKGANGRRDDNDEPVGKPEYDELLPQAVDVIFDTKQASVSMLQRRLKLGYSRAARIVDQMEELGIIGPFEGSKPRQILITRDQWLEMQTTQGTAPTETLKIQTEFADDVDNFDE